MAPPRGKAAAKAVPKDRDVRDPKTSVKAPPKKSGGGGKYTLGKPGDENGIQDAVEAGDPNYDPEEKRVDPEDGAAYTFDELAKFYKGKYKKKALEEYWEYECVPVKPKKARAGAKEKAGPLPSEVAPKTKAKAARPKAPAKRLTQEDLDTDGPLAKEVAAVIPYFPYKKLEKFYDVQGLLKHPKLLNAVCAVMAKRYRKLDVTKLAGFEAHGFIFTPVAIKLGVPFIMLRKGGKMPNTISSEAYTKEYESIDSICVQKDAIVAGDKVVLIDDLIATGDTLCAGIELVKACEAEVVECACMVELKDNKGRDRCLKAGAKQVWSFISEELLTLKADIPEEDGKS